MTDPSKADNIYYARMKAKLIVAPKCYPDTLHGDVSRAHAAAHEVWLWVEAYMETYMLDPLARMLNRIYNRS